MGALLATPPVPANDPALNDTVAHENEQATRIVIVGHVDHGKSTLIGRLLHDTGKAMVPDAILNKQGRLSDAEFDVVKRHPRDGHDILVRTAGIGPIRNVRAASLAPKLFLISPSASVRATRRIWKRRRRGAIGRC